MNIYISLIAASCILIYVLLQPFIFIITLLRLTIFSPFDESQPQEHGTPMSRLIFILMNSLLYVFCFLKDSSINRNWRRLERAASSLRKIKPNDFTGDPQGQCIICMEDLESSSTVQVLPCNHLFCGGCLFNYLRNRNACPICSEHVILVTPLTVSSCNCMSMLEDRADMFGIMVKSGLGKIENESQLPNYDDFDGNGLYLVSALLLVSLSSLYNIFHTSNFFIGVYFIFSVMWYLIVFRDDIMDTLGKE